MAMPLLNFSCMVVSNSCLEYGKVTTIVTTNFEFAGAAGGEGAGVVGNGEADVCKLPAEGLVSAGGEGVVGEAVVQGASWHWLESTQRESRRGGGKRSRL